MGLEMVRQGGGGGGAGRSTQPREWKTGDRPPQWGSLTAPQLSPVVFKKPQDQEGSLIPCAQGGWGNPRITVIMEGLAG